MRQKTVAIIHFNTPELTEAGIKSLRKHGGEDYRVIVFDNSATLTLPDGKVIQPNYLTRSFHNILKNSDLPMVRLHDLRHSTASNLIEQNVSIVNVANWLGHSSPTTTLNFYAHTNQAQKKMVANVIDDMLLVR